ncbi:glycosyl transferase [Paenibacillus sp. P3E]|uniref:glycosyltransferase family 2 protein n=1 Tax=Paenibacillus sp. P3E TaxID=1349435 RepID=UPI00093CDD69|nr:glycosyltransferase [Paenibacillus sp. P3E]OKP69272.1 glycosyl transferase [Paenibacillus sp. P3E]
MSIRYSIIIPTYNRHQQLLLTLASFETQTYPKQHFEVIVADDGSTDGTREMVEGFQASYQLTYVSHPEQRGRSAIRNLGLQHAKGLYIIFCDADFLVLPEFISTVRRYHRKYPKAVLSGIPHSWDDAYTHYYPDFSPEEKEHFRNTVSPSSLWNPEFEIAADIIPLITPEDILHHTEALSKVVFTTKVPPDTRQQFAKTDIAPWMLLVTRCVAIRRSQLTRIGGFNEQFVLYGLEDWDLGYRLHRLKIRFRSIKEVIGYHQEHPTHLRGNVFNTDNLRIMYKQYGFNDSSLNLFALVPPSEDLEKYKETLRILRRGFRSKLTRSSAVMLRRTLRIAAKKFYYQNNLLKRQRSLRRIEKKARGRKSQVAHVLREMLVKTQKLGQ